MREDTNRATKDKTSAAFVLALNGCPRLFMFVLFFLNSRNRKRPNLLRQDLFCSASFFLGQNSGGG